MLRSLTKLPEAKRHPRQSSFIFIYEKNKLSKILFRSNQLILNEWTSENDVTVKFTKIKKSLNETLNLL